MRRLLTGFVVAAVFAVVPALAMAGYQQVAEEIANRFLRSSGQISDYKIGVKYHNGDGLAPPAASPMPSR